MAFMKVIRLRLRLRLRLGLRLWLWWHGLLVEVVEEVVVVVVLMKMVEQGLLVKQMSSWRVVDRCG